MYWFTHQLESDQSNDVERLFAAQYAALGRRDDMMLIEGHDGMNRRRLYIGVTDASLLDRYDSFEACWSRDIPKAPDLLIGNRAVFRALFSNGLSAYPTCGTSDAFSPHFTVA